MSAILQWIGEAYHLSEIGISGVTAAGPPAMQALAGFMEGIVGEGLEQLWPGVEDALGQLGGFGDALADLGRRLDPGAPLPPLPPSRGIYFSPGECLFRPRPFSCRERWQFLPLPTFKRFYKTLSFQISPLQAL